MVIYLDDDPVTLDDLPDAVKALEFLNTISSKPFRGGALEKIYLQVLYRYSLDLQVGVSELLLAVRATFVD